MDPSGPLPATPRCGGASRAVASQHQGQTAADEWESKRGPVQPTKAKRVEHSKPRQWRQRDGDPAATTMPGESMHTVSSRQEL